MQTNPTPCSTSRSGFTILELAVTVIIIAVLAVVALPMYQRTILKSKYSALLPVAQHLKLAQEAYYTGHSYYSDDLRTLDLDTPGTIQNATTTQYGDNMRARISPNVDDEEEYSYVLTSKEGLNNNYIMYQEHSKNYPGEIHCEAKEGDNNAQWLCSKALHGTLIEKGSITPGYTTYILSGTGKGTFLKQCLEEADTDQTCSSGCGVMSRSATCNDLTGQWEYGAYDPTTCKDKPDESISCSTLDPKWTSGTATRSVSCGSNNEWTEPQWDDSACEIACKEEEKVLTQLCEGCGIQTRTLQGCNTKTGQWEYNDDWTQCPVKPSEEEACEEGSELMKTRSVTCSEDKTTWQADENWDTSNCKKECTKEKPLEQQSCQEANKCGLETRTVDCDYTTGEWIEPAWNTSACTSAPAEDTTECDSPFTYGTKTSSYTCTNDTWQENWNTNSCGYACTGTAPTQQATCPSGCGKYTTTAACDYTSGIWSNQYNGSTKSCPKKPADTKESCGKNMTGAKTYTHVCNAAGTALGDELVFQSSSCAEVPAGGTFSGEGNYCEKDGDGCNGYTFTDAADCWGKCNDNVYRGSNTNCFAGANSCQNGEFRDGAMCQVGYYNVPGVCTGGTYYAYSSCWANGGNSCSGSTFKNWSHCRARYAGDCVSTYEGNACCYAESSGLCPSGSPKCKGGTLVRDFVWDGKTYWP